jgi:arsenate reductase
MAEGILRKYVGDRFHILSAGLNPDRIHPMVVPVMREMGIDISRQRSKSVQEYLGKITAHYMIVVCEHAERNCPKIFPGVGERLYWPFDDPAAAVGTYEERLAKFRQIRDQIDEKLRAWLVEQKFLESGEDG